MNEAERTKRRAEIMLAAKYDDDGNVLNLEHKGNNGWEKAVHAYWNWSLTDYRIIEPPPAPEYVPYDFFDAEDILGMVVKDDSVPFVTQIIAVNGGHVLVPYHAPMNYDNPGRHHPIISYTFYGLFVTFKKLDGSPCGKLKK